MNCHTAPPLSPHQHCFASVTAQERWLRHSLLSRRRSMTIWRYHAASGPTLHSERATADVAASHRWEACSSSRAPWHPFLVPSARRRCRLSFIFSPQTKLRGERVSSGCFSRGNLVLRHQTERFNTSKEGKKGKYGILFLGMRLCASALRSF